MHLGAAKPHIVRNSAQEIVAAIGRENRSKSVFKVIPAASIEADAVDIKPSTPEQSANPVDVARQGASGVVPAAQIDNGLNVKVDNSNNSRWSKKVGERVDY